ncbi:MAG: hypothetical protein BroJett029_30990 [Alphaproteobacteria bacterium]|nr:MAG: hypothetical protein BroJett029_30990 [Alphaproteobacteria bacterium]
MVELSRLCSALDLDAAAAAAALAAADPQQRPPVYIQALLGVGAWISALLMVGFVLLMIGLVMGGDTTDQMPVTVAMGVVCFAVAVGLRRAGGAGAFRLQLASALSIAGVGLAAAAVAVYTDSFAAGAAVAASGTAAATMEGRDRPTQFLSAALAVGLAFAALALDAVPYLTDIAALLGAAGVALTLWPPRRDMAPLAAVLLLALPCLMAVGDSGVLAGAGAEGEGVPARLIAAALIVGLLVLHRRLGGRAGIDAIAGAQIAAIVAVCALLPPGGSAALMLMMLAFVTGARGLAALAVLLQVYFVWRFYYDLQVTLLEKSLILMAMGAVLLGIYALILRRAEPVR